MKGKIADSMDDKEEIKKVIDDFFTNASEQDLRELEELLASHQQNMPQFKQQNKQQKQSPLGKMDVNNIANRFASDLTNRMGLTTDQINRSARDAVRTMILQYDPYIPEDQINTLLNTWVPKKNNKSGRVPEDAMRAMISQYVAYGIGELTDEQIKTFPEGWAKKYWSFFPEQIQVLIRAYIKDEITKSTFLEVLEKVLKK
jgi:hypothetical protein